MRRKKVNAVGKILPWYTTEDGGVYEKDTYPYIHCVRNVEGQLMRSITLSPYGTVEITILEILWLYAKNAILG